MKKPLIGLTPAHNTENQDTYLRPGYPKALSAAGAIPFAELLRQSAPAAIFLMRAVCIPKRVLLYRMQFPIK